ncbi:hypothetical protein KP509_16G036100 [Ceratopteris richardii]|uniref:Uncharacterized protein n=1 Tax=Ceratopteris richardii TaxID=49495 RepID=A0A8T2T1H7_CERRI|nr:hypothetical protein KP509_16G036100 [Ceratopteris richardii]
MQCMIQPAQEWIPHSGVGNTKSSVGQQVVKVPSNAMFGLFMLGVLVFTVCSVRYQPLDPWLEPGQAVSEQVKTSLSPLQKMSETLLLVEEMAMRWICFLLFVSLA